MADVTITVTPAQSAVLRDLDPNLTVRAIVQAHVDTWLAPLVADRAEEDRQSVRDAYVSATASVQLKVRQELGLG